jgi:hypothetical protein
MTNIEKKATAGSLGWQLALAAATIAGTLATACMMPFVALATVTAATMPRRLAAATIVGIWAVNQLLGFTLLGYPTDLATVAWGGALGAATLVAMLTAAAVLGRRAPALPRLVVAFTAAFACYEAGLFAFALVVGGTDTFTAGIVGQILLNDVCWCGALVAIHAVLTRAAPRAFGPPLGLEAA